MEVRVETGSELELLGRQTGIARARARDMLVTWMDGRPGRRGSAPGNVSKAEFHRTWWVTRRSLHFLLSIKELSWMVSGRAETDLTQLTFLKDHSGCSVGW